MLATALAITCALLAGAAGADCANDAADIAANSLPSAAVLGASGNVGAMIVKELLGNGRWGKVVLIGRRKLPEYDGNAMVQQHVVDMGKVREESEPILKDAGVTAAFMALGVGVTRNLPGGEEGKRELMRVDVDIPAAFASAAKSAGVQHFSLLGSVGADEKATYSCITHTGAGGGYYMHCKGLIERKVTEEGFRTCGLFRPATLIGNSNTPGFFNWLAPKLDWAVPNRYHSIEIGRLGRAMVAQAESALQSESPAVFVAEGPSLLSLA
eukprot:TRINITY_DN254_c0_g1_i10.p1 TRINITY_DN254_c0_g1~~TRINITY_DN254_c0_g1_i10.p1  ORF type:complete len:269 (+),score=83.66 TRINITY_DN254_c0_g1_i10:66-872(+)